jgi:ribulose-phosphate 3-epimerase
VAWRDWVRGVEVEPSLYAADFMRLGDQVEALLDAGARVFHVDVGDGRFIRPITIGPVVVQSLAPSVHAAAGRLDCHLMVADPEPHFEQIQQAGGDSVTFHVEACDDVQRAVGLARDLGLGVGVAFNPGTPVETAVSVSAGVDLALCMSVHPGYSGQAFLPESIERVRQLRSLLPEETLVQIDGGLTDRNVGAVHDAGAQLIVAGSSIFQTEDIAGAYAGLVRALEE